MGALTLATLRRLSRRPGHQRGADAAFLLNLGWAMTWKTRQWSDSAMAIRSTDKNQTSAAGYAVMACWSRPRSRVIREVMKEGRPVDSILMAFSDPSHELV
jgi:hypothetical protein